MPSAAAALARLCDPAAKVSAHYLIDEDGSIVALVPEQRARLARRRQLPGRGATRLNDCSIGIELVNPGHEWGYRPFPEPQYAACIELCRALLARWPIPAARVLGAQRHRARAQAGPGRAVRLAAARRRRDRPVAGARRRAAPRSVGQLQDELARIGYAVPRHGRLDAATRAVVAAFQRHFRPERVDGAPDQATLARLDGLLALLGEA